jgi:hypothetical protein
MAAILTTAIERKDSLRSPCSAVHRSMRISEVGVSNMIRAGVEIGAKPINSFGAFDDIPLADLRFEAWTGQRWVAAQIDASIEQFHEKMDLVRSVSAAYSRSGGRQAWKTTAHVG